jgi:hypothetical protein
MLEPETFLPLNYLKVAIIFATHWKSIFKRIFSSLG